MQKAQTKNKNLRVQSLGIQSLVFFSLFFLILPLRAAPVPVIALTEIVEHPSLAEAKRGILDVLKANGYEAGKNIKIIEENAQGSIAHASLIAKKFAALKPTAIVPISTSSTQIVMKAVKGMQIPVVFSSVTDPVEAGIVANLSSPVTDVTGSMDFPPLKEEIVLIKKLIPQIKVLGVLYSPGEANSVKTVKTLKALAGSLEINALAVNSSNQLGQLFLSMVGKVDAIYVPSDNVIFSALPTLAKLSRLHQVPIFSSDPDSVKEGLLACVGYTQYEVGKTAGQLLVKVIKGERALAIEKPKEYETVINQTTVDKIHLSIPEAVRSEVKWVG